MSYSVYLVITVALMLPALGFAFVPLMPALPYLFFVSLIFGFFDNFSHLTASNLIILGASVVFSLLIDYFSGIIGAKYGGASRRALLGGLVGVIIGLVLLPPIGGLIGLFLGVLFVELYDNRQRITAFRAATGALLGSLAGTAVNVFLALTFIVLFIIFALG